LQQQRRRRRTTVAVMATTRQAGGSDWKFGLFGCFGDMKLCLLTYLCPCYAMGKNAEGVGEDCLLHGLLSIVGLNFGPVVRWRLRHDKGIGGSMLMDVLVYMLCPWCAVVQEAREIGWSLPDQLNSVGRADGGGGDAGAGGGGGDQEISRQ